jgi:hypothetical protein
LYVDGAFYVDVEHGYLVVGPDAAELAFKGAVIFAFVYHFPFHELLFPDLFLEFFQAEKVVVDAVLFLSAGRAGGGRHGEGKAGEMRQQVPGDGGFAGPGRGGDDNDFVVGFCHGCAKKMKRDEVSQFVIPGSKKKIWAKRSKEKRKGKRYWYAR